MSCQPILHFNVKGDLEGFIQLFLYLYQREPDLTNALKSIFSQANCIDSTAEAEAVFAGEVKKMRAEKMKPLEQVTLEPYERDHAVVVGVYRQPQKGD